MGDKKAYLIDVAAQQVREVTWSNVSDMQKHVGGYIECAIEFPWGDVLYVDEEGLLKPAPGYFRLVLGEGISDPLVGNGLLVGKELEDETTADPQIPIEHLRRMVEFRSKVQVDAWAKAHASDPAVSFQAEGEEPETIATIGQLYDAGPGKLGGDK